MGMFDTIHNVPVKCPRCGDEGPKSVQIKSGPQRLDPQRLDSYEFGKGQLPRPEGRGLHREEQG